MALIAIETNEYPDEINLLEEGEPVRGGMDGPDNRALRQLTNRTNWLKLKLENLTPGEPGSGGNLPPLPEGVPYWTFLGIAETVADVELLPIEGYPEYSYVLCLGHVWAIVEGVWKDMGTFVAPSSGGGIPDDPSQPHTNFLGVLGDPSQLAQVPATMFRDYSFLMCKGHVYFSIGGEWSKTSSFESGEGGGGGDGEGGASFPEAPIDGFTYGRKDGDWGKVELDARKCKNLVEISTIDPNINVFYKLDNTMPTQKKITLKSGPGMAYPYEDYGIAVTLIVSGIVGELVFEAEDRAPILWHKGVQPILYAQRTVFILLWTGDEWMCGTGPQIP